MVAFDREHRAQQVAALAAECEACGDRVVSTDASGLGWPRVIYETPTPRGTVRVDAVLTGDAVQLVLTYDGNKRYAMREWPATGATRAWLLTMMRNAAETFALDTGVSGKNARRP